MTNPVTPDEIQNDRMGYISADEYIATIQLLARELAGRVEFILAIHPVAKKWIEYVTEQGGDEE